MKELTKEEAVRVTKLNKVWDYLFKRKEYALCEAISYEIGKIKETL